MTQELELEEALFARVSKIIETAKGQVARTVNTAMLHAYWFIGREIVEVEQEGKERAKYGEEVIKKLSKRLTGQFGKGFSVPTLKRMRQFYQAFPEGSLLPEKMGGSQKGSTLLSEFQESNEGNALATKNTDGKTPLFPGLLGWSHYLVLLKISQQEKRMFYEIEAAQEAWSVRELERQIGSMLYERLAKSRDKEQVIALAKEGQKVSHPKDVIKDPMVLEFLGLEERANWLERDLEQAIIDRLETFLLELGKGFCFVARQKRLTIEGDHFYADLVFYNRLLRCFVLIDLKMDKLTHQDLGQMQMYVNYFDRYQREEWEAPTIGIILCSEKNDTMVRITLPEDNEQIIASTYQLYLPTEEELRQEVATERERIEQAQHLLKEPEKAEEETE